MKKSFFTAASVLMLASQIHAQSANAQTVMNNYAAFGRGDIPTILASLAPDCRWSHPGNPAIIPFAGTFVGADQIAGKFFASIPTAVEITAFQPSLVSDAGDVIVTSVYIKGRGIATGKEYDNTAEMRWTFNAEGKVVSYEVMVDTTGLEAALTK